MQQTEMPGAERTELGQRAYEVIEQKGKIKDEQEVLDRMLDALMNHMRSTGTTNFKANGHSFALEMGEKLRITKGQ